MEYPEDVVVGLKRFCAFIIIYVPHWLRASFASDCQVNDLQYRKDLGHFSEVDPEIAAAVLEVFLRHVDFLAPEWAILSLVSTKVSLEDKEKMAKEIISVPKSDLRPAPPKPIVPITSSTTLDALVKSPRVHLLFHLLTIDESFLAEDPKAWGDDPEYQKLERYVRNVRVVNDCAENAIQLASDLNNKVTKDESQRRFLYHTVAKQRREKKEHDRKSHQSPGTATPIDRSALARRKK